MYSAANEYQHSWEGRCDGLASCPGESVQYYNSTLSLILDGIFLNDNAGQVENCEHTVSVLRLSRPSSLMYRASINAVRDAAVRKCECSARA